MNPKIWLGARSPFGLALPEARPTSSQLYAPRGVWIDDQRLIVCDSGNHRVLIWNRIPCEDGQAADLVLGQSHFEAEGPARGEGSVAMGMHLPTGVLVADGKRLIVADAWHHRLLVWNDIPTENGQPADYAIGQSSLDRCEPNRGEGPSARSLYWPYGIAIINGCLYVADTGNRRVLGWEGIPSNDRAADWVIGQEGFVSNLENRGGAVCGNSFRWPHAIAGDSDRLWVADAGNHRILGWDGIAKSDRKADWVLGQRDSCSSTENPYTTQGASALRFPYGLSIARGRLAVADTANNRVLFWNMPPAIPHFAPATDVIGQTDFDQHGENRWTSVTHQTLCWPYGIAAHQDWLAIADSGNNRVMLWSLSGTIDTPSEEDGSIEEPLQERGAACV